RYKEYMGENWLPPAEPGHNGPPEPPAPAPTKADFKAILAENMRGLYIAQRNTLVRAIRDPGLSHRHRVILAEIIIAASSNTGLACPGYKGLAEATGYSEPTVELA